MSFGTQRPNYKDWIETQLEIELADFEYSESPFIVLFQIPSDFEK